jgi:hypothetical protein
MTAKMEALALLDMAPDDVTLDEVIYWVQVMCMVGGGLSEDMPGAEDVSPGLRRDIKRYFADGNSRHRVRDTSPVEGIIP